MKNNISAKEKFTSWRETISNIHHRLYYRDQSPDSFQSLYNLVQSFAPDVIVECGTMSGLSLRCWLLASDSAKIKCIDLSFNPLQESMKIFPLDLSRVDLIQSDILTVDFSTLWNSNDRVLFFVDAHDVPGGTSIMRHILTNAVPHLPEGSLIVVDDVWHSPELITKENAEELYHNLVLPETDELLSFEAHYAPYHKGGSFWGFSEVIPLLYYINKHAIELEITPKCKHVSFISRKEPAQKSINFINFDSECGKYYYHPLSSIKSGNDTVDKCFQRAAKLYDKGEFSTTLSLLIDLRNNFAGTEGIDYAIALVLARTGEFKMAANFLERDLASLKAYKKSRQLHTDIHAAFIRHKAPDKPHSSGVTIFAVPKAFKGHENIIQRNAIQSWLKIEQKPNIIFMGNDEGTAEVCKEFNLVHIPDIKCNHYGTPRLDDIFLKAQEAAETEILCYINADILVFDDFMQAIALASRKFENFLLVGARLDYDIDREIDFSQPDVVTSIVDEAFENGTMHAPTGMDYFAFKPGYWDNIPPFALGRIAWDSWLIHEPLRQKLPVIDCTSFFIPIHQNHGYAHVPSGQGAIGLYGNTDSEAICNRLLAGPLTNKDNVNAAPFFMHKNGAIIRRAGK